MGQDPREMVHRNAGRAGLAVGSAEESSVYDALADLFLGEDAPAPCVETAPSQRGRAGTREAGAGEARIEWLVLGHLPVFAAGWVMQYARERSAQMEGPVALVRVSGGVATVELVGGDAPRVSELEEAVRVASGRARAWLIRDEEARREPEGDVTLLTGADEAAIVRAYQIIKQTVRDPTHRVRIVVMGAARDKAEESGCRLQQAVTSLLRRSVELGAPVARIGGVGAATVFRGECASGASEVAGMIRRFGGATFDDQPARPDHTGGDIASPALESAGAASESGSDPGPDAGARTPPAPPGGSLASRIDGLAPLRARCPFAEDVELALDGEGRIHVVASAADGGVARAVEALTSVAAWAGVHHRVLALTTDSRVADPARARPTAHLVVDDALLGRALLDTPVRVHALRSVRVGDQTAFVCLPLN